MPERRRALLILHPQREVAVNAARTTCNLLKDADLIPVFIPEEHERLAEAGFDLSGCEVLGVDCTGPDLEIVMVLGGDGTILRAAEVVRYDATPIIGVNLGHVGFLAESERDDLEEAVRRVVRKEYEVEERLALTVTVRSGGQVIAQDWALNEATIEKPSSNKMINVRVSIDGHPLTGFGCDGVMVSTPTGSTAYAFSAGGPIVWPSLAALLFVPLNAHALFARPLVIDPRFAISVCIGAEDDGALIWCDGRRTIAIGPDAEVTVSQSNIPVRLARLRIGSFVERLVNKFALPPAGWRSRGELKGAPNA